ncbi:hypothetical protein [Thalassomonas actiniarum]|uniref:Uncharacterized protein n=1 Tax=Thalassomonas actiniarum TaxID=485447 RepID=A0AAE9YNS9_9GAMM|nr:hypothetical protein [Thalassomonas actiniarum]WDD98494.1 hypothetical protein SG35_025110 [Thalassomonas actiniarum]
MRKKAIVALAFGTAFYLAQLDTESNSVIAESSVVEKRHQQSDKYAPEPLPQTNSQAKAILINNTSPELSPKKIPYEGDWCIGGIDLTEADFLFANQESADWDRERGRIHFNTQDLYGNYSDRPGADLIEPYREMSKENLLAQVDSNDRYAMIAAVQRYDLSLDTIIEIARKLVIFGDTSLGLLSLYSIEQSAARSEYSKKQRVTAKVKRHMKEALMYVFYGVSRYDTSLLANYLMSLERDEPFNSTLKPYNVLSPQDFDDVKHEVKVFSQMLDKRREQYNLVPIGEIDVPKIATHDFQSSLGTLYLDHGKDLDKLQSLNADTGPNIKRSACVTRHFKLFGKYH